MIETTSLPAQPKERISTYLYFSSLYFVSVGVLYLWGYWSTFDINILEYLSLADILKLTAYPIAYSLLLTGFGAVGGLGLASRKTDPVKGIEPRAVGFLVKHGFWVQAIYIVTVPAFAIFAPVWKWSILPALLTVPVLITFGRHAFFMRLMPNDEVRTFILFCLIVMIPQAYGLGRIHAERIIEGQKFQYVLSEVDGADSVANTPVAQRLRYLGHAGDFVFFRDPVKPSLLITKFESGKSLVLQHHENPPGKSLAERAMNRMFPKTAASSSQ